MAFPTMLNKKQSYEQLIDLTGLPIVVLNEIKFVGAGKLN